MNAPLIVLSIASFAAAPQDVLYDFYSSTCGPCQMMMPTVARLHAEGLPIVKVNIGERPDLANRYGIEVVPTFVLVVGGKEQDRVTGYQEESALRALLARIPQSKPPEETTFTGTPARRSRPIPVHTVEDEHQPKWNFHLPLPPFPGKKREVVEIEPASRASAGPIRGVNVEPERNARQMAEAPRSGTGTGSGAGNAPAKDLVASPDSDAARRVASSVRIRLQDRGVIGSGVAIGTAGGRTVILTCGHILRDAGATTRVEVDVFDGMNSRAYQGSIVKFDLDADVGLVTIPATSEVATSAVATAGEVARVGESVVSVGCSGGEPPSIERLRVTSLNRYQGPDTIECTGVPKQGRSGGGLFTAAGHIVGICTNADPREGRGVYAGLNPIHGLLRKVGLETLIPSAAQSEPDAFAEAAEPANEPRSKAPSRKTRLEAELAELNRSRSGRPTAEGREPAASRETGTEEQGLNAADDAEVICIIRQPNAASRVVIINRASPKFMSFLTGENKDQLMPTSWTKPAERGSDRAPRDADDQSPRTSSAWKPSVASRWADLGGDHASDGVGDRRGTGDSPPFDARSLSPRSRSFEFQPPRPVRIARPYVRSDETR